MNNDLQDKVALVTGASRGIGAAIADKLAAEGARVFGTATSEVGATAISGRGVEGLTGLQLNVNDADGISAVLSEIAGQAGAPTILVNNAGAGWLASLEDFPEQGWDKVMNLNVKAPFFLTKA